MSRAVPRFRRTNPALPPAVPNLFEVSVLGTLEGQLTINTFYYADGGAALVSATETNLANGFVTSQMPNYRAMISADVTVNYVKAQCLTSPSRMPATVTVGLIGLGPAGHEPSTAGITLWRYSTIKGQAGRGHITLPGCPSTWVTGSQLNGTGTAALGSNPGALMGTGFTASGVTYSAQIVSRKNKAGPALGAAPVYAAGYRLTLGSVRRRKIGRGK